MIQPSLKPQIQGTRTGYVIRFTCPACHTENTIVNKTPREHFRATRDATCKQCRKRSTVLTPGINDKPALSYVQSYYPCTKLQ
jgi:transcription elongation factor Elf1